MTGFLLAGCGESDGGPARPDLSPEPPAETDLFSKSVSVFGVMIRATAATPNEAILHAAQVLAEYLDNDEDGTPDNPAIVEAMVSGGATLIMARNEAELRSSANSEISDWAEDAGDTDSWQGLWGSEVFPNGRAEGRFDATLEEVLHLITHVGYARAYPAIFGEEAGSALAGAMDVARGGRFLTVPARYPDKAWYTYDDSTCDYACQVTEYLYWALTSVLGAQDYPGRIEEIRHEWRLNTRALVRATDARVYELISDPHYGFATILPDGVYSARTFTINE